MLRGLDGFFDTQSVYANCAVLRVRRGLVSQDFGGHSEGETPLPIPNRVVKPLSADGTWPERAWESRSPPIYLLSRPFVGGSFFVRIARRVLGGGLVWFSSRQSACADWSSWSRTTQAPRSYRGGARMGPI